MLGPTSLVRRTKVRKGTRVGAMKQTFRGQVHLDAAKCPLYLRVDAAGSKGDPWGWGPWGLVNSLEFGLGGVVFVGKEAGLKLHRGKSEL